MKEISLIEQILIGAMFIIVIMIGICPRINWDKLFK